MYEQILYGVSDHVATVTLNRPDRLNAWTRKMEEEVTAAIRDAAADDGVRAIVLTGAGRGFCAGADMSLLSSISQSGLTSAHREVSGNSLEENQRQHSWLLSVPKPVIAAINGPAVGLGFVIPLYCDYRIAAASASFNVIFSRRGLIAEYGIAWILPRLIGLPATIDLIFSSRKVDSQEAQQIGLVHKVLPDASFSEAAHHFARDLASTVSPRSLRVMKKQIYDAQSQSLNQAMDAALAEMVESLACEDFKEGVAHFLEKRQPKFVGR
ncbi:MAG TPA: enoyl-CoA hydratase [Bryobacteraceae bacterium]|nr:enoyl-CoA hydratase [Bryobacteraceae bacterium]